MTVTQVIKKCANPWNILSLEQQKKLHPSQPIGRCVSNVSPTLKLIICHNCWRSVSSWTFYGQLLEELPNREGSDSIDEFLESL